MRRGWPRSPPYATAEASRRVLAEFPSSRGSQDELALAEGRDAGLTEPVSGTIGVRDVKYERAPWLKDIEGDAAEKLIESRAPLIRVVAGPGAGKTTCLKSRVRRQVEGDGVRPSSIFVGTFTRAIATELNQNLGQEIEVSTLHSLAFRLLRQYPGACQGMKLRFLLKFEEDALLYDIRHRVPELPTIHDRRDALRLLQACRSRRGEFENAAFGGAVREWLRRHQSMLINEVVYLCVVGLENGDIRLGGYDHVVIDEYQDLTAAEQELVEMIWSNSGSLTVMGDDDQSIYGFRFNHPEGIEAFRDRWWCSDLEDLSFEENWRCGEEILRMANLMMAEAGTRKPPMIPRSGRSGRLTCVYWPSLESEVDGLAEYIRSRKSESFLVLVPRRFVGYRLAGAIGSDAKTAFREQVLEHVVAQEAFTAASVLANPEDRVAARAWLGFHGTHHKHGSRRNSDAYAGLPPDLSGHELLRGIAEGGIAVSGPGREQVKRRAEEAVALLNRALSPDDAIALLFDDGRADGETDGERRRRLLGDLGELRSAAQEILEHPSGPTLRRVVDVLRYRIATRAPLRGSEDGDSRVKIMTLHSAKGLEADNVVIMGAADQLIPGAKTEVTERNEQRRLLYVAITRAKESLVVSWPQRIRMEELKKNMGRLDDIVTESGVKWAVTSRTSLFPQGLSGAVRGRTLLRSTEG